MHSSSFGLLPSVEAFAAAAARALSKLDGASLRVLSWVASLLLTEGHMLLTSALVSYKEGEEGAGLGGVALSLLGGSVESGMLMICVDK